jgi:hypothetical protein
VRVLLLVRVLLKTTNQAWNSCQDAGTQVRPALILGAISIAKEPHHLVRFGEVAADGTIAITSGFRP